MSKKLSRGLVAGLCGAAIFAGSTAALADASATERMRACKNAVLEKSEFRGLPQAAVSVFHGKDKKHPTYTVRWDGLNANGKCKVGSEGKVKKVRIDKIHDNRSDDRYNDNRYNNNNNYNYNGNSNHWDNSSNGDDFYYDRHTGQWRDPAGDVCHSCTPDNGFPYGGYD